MRQIRLVHILCIIDQIGLHSVLISSFITIIYCFSSRREENGTKMRFLWTCLRRRRPGAFDTWSFLFGIVISSLSFMGYFLLRPHCTCSSVPVNLFTRKQSRLDLVASVSKELTSLPTCPYNPSFLIRGTIARYSGWWRIKESLVFPRDDTDMLSRGSPWHWFQPSPLADRKKVSVVVNKLLTTFQSRYEVDLFFIAVTLLMNQMNDERTAMSVPFKI